MPWTKTDESNVDAAILALAKGEREVSVTLGDKQIRHSDAQIDEMRELRTKILVKGGWHVVDGVTKSCVSAERSLGIQHDFSLRLYRNRFWNMIDIRENRLTRIKTS